MRFGQVASDLKRGPLPKEVPSADRLVMVYCGPHGKHQKRRLVAVVNKSGRLLTTVEDVDWVRPPYDAVLAPCDLCSLARSGPGGQRKGERRLSVKKLHARVRAGGRPIRLDQVLADMPLAPPAGTS